jgi:hypothetical protein
MPAGGSSPIPNPAPAASTFGGPRQARGPSRRNKNASAREGRDGSRTVPIARSRYAALRGLLNRLHGTKEICAPSRPQGILCHPKANLAILRTFGERANLVTLGETSRGKDPTAWLGWDCVILARMSRKRWSYRLSRPIPVKDGPTLRTLDDVRMFMLDNLPEEDQARRSWQKACEILLAAADGLADVRAATRQVELALFQQAKWMAK